ncbi:hypothetical protein LSTR_LSTR001009 [Laodelphax striatellus]|uniref:Uncharacterized protein n=1 Tax=Laodelphax striatellus TaxID=195883 RepID=A0A482X1T6_LAOST|nr:hypothetical protein LSTR_LSTR001009 [Laodelphax striatellus]
MRIPGDLRLPSEVVTLSDVHPLYAQASGNPLLGLVSLKPGHSKCRGTDSLPSHGSDPRNCRSSDIRVDFRFRFESDPPGRQLRCQPYYFLLPYGPSRDSPVTSLFIALSKRHVRDGVKRRDQS